MSEGGEGGMGGGGKEGGEGRGERRISFLFSRIGASFTGTQEMFCAYKILFPMPCRVHYILIIINFFFSFFFFSLI